ncbi:hypothetical protein AAAU36_01710 [Phascolarctobacterium faecium]|uniref:hypothetical protein n=1 Tax=Phascolarctobacterium faecium TaxID=33025 RepID=UPI0015AFEBD7|nr:hypothetical protein [uncultured Phascolarctobacterium sp.]
MNKANIVILGLLIIIFSTLTYQFNLEWIILILQAFFAAIFTFILYFFQQQYAAKQTEQTLLISLNSEVISLIDTLKSFKISYDNTKNGESSSLDAFYMSIEYNFLHIYDSNADKLGFITNKKLLDDIIRTYSFQKRLFSALLDLQNNARNNMQFHLAQPSKNLLAHIDAHKVRTEYIYDNSVPNAIKMLTNLNSSIANNIK